MRITALKSRLNELNDQIEDKRAEAGRRWQDFEQKRDALATAGNGADYTAAEQAHERYKPVAEEVGALEEERQRLFALIGGGSTRSDVGAGELAGRQRAWADVAATLHGARGGHGAHRAHLSDLLRPLTPQAAIGVTPSSAAGAPSILAPSVPPGQDTRFLHTLLNEQRLDSGVLSVDEWRVKSGRKTGTATAATDVVNVTAHGFVAGDRVVFTSLTGGTGLTAGQTYFVMASGLTANAFKVAATSGGSAVDITVDYSALTVLDLTQQGRVVSGNVLRDPLDTSEKATESLDVELNSESLKQVALVIPDIPNQLLESVDRFQEWLIAEAGYQLARRVDTHVLSQIAAAGPLVGNGGTGLIEQLRYGVAQMREVGAVPSIAAVSPTNSVTLDLSKDSQGQYFFALKPNGADGIWRLRIVEVPGITSTTLIDPFRLGVLYEGEATVLTDPYTGASTNKTRIREEANCLFHVRDPNGALTIA